MHSTLPQTAFKFFILKSEPWSPGFVYTPACDVLLIIKEVLVSCAEKVCVKNNRRYAQTLMKKEQPQAIWSFFGIQSILLF